MLFAFLIICEMKNVEHKAILIEHREYVLKNPAVFLPHHLHTAYRSLSNLSHQCTVFFFLPLLSLTQTHTQSQRKSAF